ncbi:hypothetical protein MJH12_05680, partial [bacterium]|nr:hypothetical protein [bacterium]
TDQLSFMSSVDDFHDLIMKNNQLFSLSDAKSHNNQTNLFSSLSDGSDTTQVSFFPQGISGRAVILDSQNAILAVSAFANLSNKLPLQHQENCSSTYQNKVYLFGSGASSNQIQEYSPKADEFYTLSETLPFSAPFSCAYDQIDKVYFQSGETFWYFSLLEKKFWPLANVLAASPSTQGALSYQAGNIYFLDFQTAGNSNFYAYSVAGDSWITRNTPAFAYDQSSLIAMGTDIFLIGNKNGIYNKKFATGSNSWTDISTQASISGTNTHHIALKYYDSNHFLLVGGSNAQGTTSTLFLYDIVGNNHQLLPPLQSNISKVASYLQDQQLYIFGGIDNNRDFMIHPINAINSNLFTQLYQYNINSGARTWLSSSTRFAYADLNSDASLIAYSNSDYGINLFDISTKSHSSIRPSTSGTAITNIRFAKDNDYLYFSQLTPTSEEFLRITSDGANIENLSNGKLMWLTF